MPINLVESPDGLLASLIYGHLPIHRIQQVIVDDQENRGDPQVIQVVHIAASITFFQGIPAQVICFLNGAKNAKVRDFDRFALHLDNVAQTFGQTAPKHVK